MMEIGECGIKCAEDIEEAIKEYNKEYTDPDNWWDAAETLRSCCKIYGDRFYGLLCELAAKKILGMTLELFPQDKTQE